MLLGNGPSATSSESVAGCPINPIPASLSHSYPHHSESVGDCPIKPIPVSLSHSYPHHYVSQIMEPYIKDLIQAVKEEFSTLIEGKIGKGTSLKPLNEILQKVISQENKEMIQKGSVKAAGYAQRFFSDESWEEWLERRTSLGRVVFIFRNYLESTPAVRARLITRLDATLVEEANDQAARLLKGLDDNPPDACTVKEEKGWSIGDLFRIFDRALTFRTARAEPSPSKPKPADTPLSNVELVNLFFYDDKGEYLVAEAIDVVFVTQNATDPNQDTERAMPNLTVIKDRLQQRIKTFQSGLKLAEEYKNFALEEEHDSKEVAKKAQELMKSEKKFLKLCRITIDSYNEISVKLKKIIASLENEVKELSEEDAEKEVKSTRIKHYRDVLDGYNKETSELKEERKEGKKRIQALKGFAEETTADKQGVETFEKIKNNIPVYQRKIDKLKEGLKKIDPLKPDDFYEDPSSEKDGMSIKVDRDEPKEL